MSLRKNRDLVCVYGDESSQNAHQYCVFGAMISPLPHQDAEILLRKLREGFRLVDEMKWTKAPSMYGNYFNGYKAVLKYFSASAFRYKALVIDTKLYPLRHAKFTSNNPELGYYKYFYQLLYSGIMKWNPEVNYCVFLDQKPKKEVGSVAVLERCINGRAYIDGLPDIFGSEICTAEEFNENDGERSACLELADLLTGMIAARWNQKITNPVKLELLAYADQILGDMTRGYSPHKNPRLNIWTFKDTKWAKK